MKISRSFNIISLDFFKSLTAIEGTTSPDTRVHTNQYSLEILENENLQKLFPESSRVKITFKNGAEADEEKGRAFIHYNQKLCRSEIKKLLNRSEMFDPADNGDDKSASYISYGTNGHKSICSEKVLQLTVESQSGGHALVLTFENYQKEIADPRALLNYEIHYREIDKDTYESRSVEKFRGRDACGNDDWIIDDHPPSPGTLENGVWLWPPENTIITDKIKPYSYYAIFVTTLLIRYDLVDFFGCWVFKHNFICI